jgi:hypothetical protein
LSQAETFTAGISGYFDHLDLALEMPTGGWATHVELRDASSGSPAGSLLATVVRTEPTDTVPGSWFAFDFSTFKVPIIAGHVYSIVLWNDAPFPPNSGFDPGTFVYTSWAPSSYRLGSMWVNTQSHDAAQSWVQDDPVQTGGADLAFRTYVATVTDKGSSLALLLGGGSA